MIVSFHYLQFYNFYLWIKIEILLKDFNHCFGLRQSDVTPLDLRKFSIFILRKKVMKL